MRKISIIGEIGLNFVGSLEIAKELALIAKRAGADFVKLQKRTIEYCYSPEELAKPCDSPWGITVEDKVRGRELSWDQIAEFDAYCKEIGIAWSASCFDLVSLRELHKRYPRRPWNKIPSALALRPEFVREVASQGILTLISAALSTDEEIDEIVETFERARCPYVINHCAAYYPAPPERLNLQVIQTFKERYGERAYCRGIGSSGHETGVLPSVVAVLMGATWVERHITKDRSLYGADQAASLEPHGLELLVRDIRSLEVILGDGVRRFYGDEKKPVSYWRPI